MRTLRVAALSAVLVVVLAFPPSVAAQSPNPADTFAADPAPHEPHAEVLAGFLSAWRTGDVDRVMVYFAPTAVVSWASSWSHATGPLQLRAWLEVYVQERGTLTGRLEHASGAHATWRLSRQLPVEIQLGLPPQDSIVEVELHDGRVRTLSQRDDPASRESYILALRALTAQQSSGDAPRERAEIAAPPRAGLPSTAAWLLATAACVVSALLAHQRSPGL